MTSEPILWCVHVRGPDDLVPVASYDDAVLMADGLNWWWQGLLFTELDPIDPIVSAVPMLWDGTPERHAADLAQLGSKGWDYAMPTLAQVVAAQEKAFAARVAAALQQQKSQDPAGGDGWSLEAKIQEVRHAVEFMDRVRAGTEAEKTAVGSFPESKWVGGLAHWTVADRAYLSVAFTYRLPEARKLAVYCRVVDALAAAHGKEGK